MSVLKEKIVFRTEIGRELLNAEVDLNFKYVSNPWSEYRRYEEGEIIYHQLPSADTAQTPVLNWYRANQRTTKGVFDLDEWDVIGGGDATFLDNGVDSFNNFIINSTESGAYSASVNGLIQAAVSGDTLGFVAGTGITLEHDSANKLIKISRGSGGGEANAGSNVGSGSNVYKTKTGTNLIFRSLVSADSILAITQNSNEIEFDVDPSQIDLSDLGAKDINDLDDVSGSPSLNQVLTWNGSGWAPASPSLASYSGSNLGSGGSSVFSSIVGTDFQFRRLQETASDPIKITQSTNSITFHWDGSEVDIDELNDIDASGASNNDVLVYNSGSGNWENTSGIPLGLTSAGSGVDIYRGISSGIAQIATLLSASNAIIIDELTDGTIEISFNENALSFGAGLWSTNTDESIYYNSNFVGINETNPQEWLHVNGNAKVNDYLYVGEYFSVIGASGQISSQPISKQGIFMAHTTTSTSSSQMASGMWITGEHDQGHATGIKLSIEGGDLHTVGVLGTIGDQRVTTPTHPQPLAGSIPSDYTSGFDFEVGSGLYSGANAGSVYGGIIRISDAIGGTHDNIGLYIDASGGGTAGTVLALHTVTGAIKIEDLTSTSSNNGQGVVVASASGVLQLIDQDTVSGSWTIDGNDIYNNNTGNVGIGLTNPQELLHLDGSIIVGNSSTNSLGNIRWNGTDFQGYTGIGWVSLTAGATTNLNLYNSDGLISSDRVIGLNGNALQIAGDTEITGQELYFHVEEAYGFLKFLGTDPILGLDSLSGDFAGDIYSDGVDIYYNGVVNNDISGLSQPIAAVLGYSDSSSSNINQIYANLEGVTIYNRTSSTSHTFITNGNVGINNDTPTHQLHVINGSGGDAAYFEGDVTIDGKLNVTGLIDPTGLVLNEQGTRPYDPVNNEGMLWVGNNSSGQTIFFTDETGTDIDLLAQIGILFDGNTDRLAKWNSLTEIGYSLMSDDGSQIYVGGAAQSGYAMTVREGSNSSGIYARTTSGGIGISSISDGGASPFGLYANAQNGTTRSIAALLGNDSFSVSWPTATGFGVVAVGGENGTTAGNSIGLYAQAIENHANNNTAIYAMAANGAINKAGVFVGDVDITGDFNVTGDVINLSHDTNGSNLEIGDGIFGGFVDGSGLTTLYGTNKITAVFSGYNTPSTDYTSALANLDYVTGEGVLIRADYDNAKMTWSDNLFGGDLINNFVSVDETAAEIKFDNSIVQSSLFANANSVFMQWENATTGVSIDSYKVGINDNGVYFNFDGDGYTFPVGDGAANQVLATDGLGQISWTDVDFNPAGADSEIQYNDNGAFGSDALFIRGTNQESFFATSSTGTDQLVIGQGQWLPHMGIPLVANGLVYIDGTGDISNLLLSGDLTYLGTIGTLISVENEATGVSSNAQINLNSASFTYNTDSGSSTVAVGEDLASMFLIGTTTQSYDHRIDIDPNGVSIYSDTNQTTFDLTTNLANGFMDGAGITTLSTTDPGRYSFVGSGDTMAQQIPLGDHAALIGSFNSDNSQASYSVFSKLGGLIGYNNTDNGDLITQIILSDNELDLRWSQASLTGGLDNMRVTLSNSGITFDFNADHYTFPIGDGTANQIMQTDGAGQLSWVDGAGGGGSSADGFYGDVQMNDGTGNFIAAANGDFNYEYGNGVLNITGVESTTTGSNLKSSIESNLTTLPGAVYTGMVMADDNTNDYYFTGVAELSSFGGLDGAFLGHLGDAGESSYFLASVGNLRMQSGAVVGERGQLELNENAQFSLDLYNGSNARVAGMNFSNSSLIDFTSSITESDDNDAFTFFNGDNNEILSIHSTGELRIGVQSGQTYTLPGVAGNDNQILQYNAFNNAMEFVDLPVDGVTIGINTGGELEYIGGDDEGGNLVEYAFFIEASQKASDGAIDLDDPGTPKSKIHVYDIVNQQYLFSDSLPGIDNFKNANELQALRNKSGNVDFFICHRFDTGTNDNFWVLKLSNVRVNEVSQTLVYDSYQNLEITGGASAHGVDFDDDYLYITTREETTIVKVNRYGALDFEMYSYTGADYYGSDNIYVHKGETLLPVYGDAPNYKQKIIALSRYGNHTERTLINTSGEAGVGSVNWPSPIAIDENDFLYYFIGGDTRSTQIVKFDLATEREVERFTINHPIKNIGTGAGVTRFKAWVHATTIHDGKLYVTTTRNPLLFIIDLDTFTIDYNGIITEAQDTETTIFYGAYGGEETGYITDDIWCQGGLLYLSAELMKTRIIVYDIKNLSTFGAPTLVNTEESTNDLWAAAFVNDKSTQWTNTAISTDRGSGQYSGKSGEHRIADEQTVNFTAVVGYLYPTHVGGVSGVTVTPPADPTPGDFFSVVDSRSNSATNNITVEFGTASQNHYASSTDHVISTDGLFAKYVYINDTIGWINEN